MSVCFDDWATTGDQIKKEAVDERRAMEQRLAVLEQKLARIGEPTVPAQNEDSESKDAKPRNDSDSSQQQQQRIEQLETELTATRVELAYAVKRRDEIAEKLNNLIAIMSETLRDATK
ncbi:hypothetical protein PENTCL1PPCAC_21931 [Pristionchus entomophagus]|uniref:Uncharacterized protein n=1 Tax=Pristionchus entomophagus TaxID=358040 RepID=A0AAV5TZY4_9BILA|nr:hypothetical protein PENTCL1PPCAC_21931 [Pristionchus entomophagus]